MPVAEQLLHARDDRDDHVGDLENFSMSSFFASFPWTNGDPSTVK
jgi:hypothetical protein